MEHIHERCSSARQGISSWMLGSREEASKISPSMGCKNRGTGGGVEGGSVEGVVERENEGGRVVEEKECWEAEGGGEGGDNTHLLRRFSAHSLGCGKLNV